jgi:hypothetical protein
MRPTAIRGSGAIDYYTALVPDESDQGEWAAAKQDGHGRVEDYYLPIGEAAGEWWGAGAHALGLSGSGTRFERSEPQTEVSRATLDVRLAARRDMQVRVAHERTAAGGWGLKIALRESRSTSNNGMTAGYPRADRNVAPRSGACSLLATAPPRR